MKGGGSEGGLLALVVIIAVIAYAIMYIAIAAGACLAAYVLFLLVRMLYVGWIKSPKADPLFSKAAKTIVRKKRLDISRFRSDNGISSDRMNLITTQLDLAGIAKNGVSCLDSVWQLHDIFRDINRSDSFFIDKVFEKGEECRLAYEGQIASASNKLTVFFLSILRDQHCGQIIMDYLNLWKSGCQAYATSEEINKINVLIRNNGAPSSVVDMCITSDAMKAFQKFDSAISALANTKLWFANHHRCRFARKSFLNLQINGSIQDVPYLKEGQNEFFFYPSFILSLHQKNNQLSLIEYSDVSVAIHHFNQLQDSWFEPTDASVAYSTWLHTCKDGSPDLRYSYNPHMIYYRFTGAAISIFKEEIVSGDITVIERIRDSFRWMYNNTPASCSIQKGTFHPTVDQAVDDEPRLTPLGQKIKQTIIDNSIKIDVIDRGLLVSLLNDYRVFETVTERKCANILRRAVSDGTMSKVMSQGLSSPDTEDYIHKFIQTSGFDEALVRSTIYDVYLSFT